MKVCSTCKEDKEITHYTTDKHKKDGLKINCKDCCKVYYDTYRQKNIDKEKNRVNKYNREKRKIDKEVLKKYKHEHYLKNRDVILAKNLNYRLINKDKLHKSRMSNISNRLKETISDSIRAVLRKRGHIKSNRTHEIIGLSPIEFKIYIESKFEPWMSWENWGKYNGELNYGWDLDHIIPVSSAITESDVYRLNHYSNLRPLCSYVNRYIKADKLSVHI
jgi:hypothetical protein